METNHRAGGVEMSDTPETDAEANNGSLCDQCVPAAFARKLERERDESIRYADSLAELRDIWRSRADAYQQDYEQMERERDIWRFRADAMLEARTKQDDATN